jgi:hypothetical protein
MQALLPRLIFRSSLITSYPDWCLVVQPTWMSLELNATLLVVDTLVKMGLKCAVLFDRLILDD